MYNKKLRCFVNASLLGSAVLLTQPAIAAVTITDQDSSIRSSGTVSSNTRTESWSVEERNANNLLAFNQTINESRAAGTNTANATASINSIVSTTMLSASGSASSSATNNETSNSFSRPRADARSEFSVTFELDIATAFELDGALSYLGERFNGGITANLRNGSGFSGTTFNLSFGDSSADSGFTQNIDLSGTLDAGIYTFSVQATSSSDAFRTNDLESSSANYNLSLKFGNWDSSVTTAVPLPASGWLFAMGLAAIRYRQRIGLRSKQTG